MKVSPCIIIMPYDSCILHNINIIQCFIVLLSEPGPQYIFVLQESVVMINCIADGEQSFWSIELANDSTDTQHQFSSRQDLLNDHGVYELPQI